MAKKQAPKEKVQEASFEPNQHIGAYGSSVVFTDRFGQAWQIEVGEGIARPLKYAR